MKSTMDLGDLLGLHILMTKISGRGELKVMVAGLGERFLHHHLIYNQIDQKLKILRA